MSNSFTSANTQTISYPHNNLYDGFGSYLTISAWLKVSSWHQGAGIISKRSNADDTIAYALNLDSFANPSIYLIVGDGAGGLYTSYRVNTTAFPTNQWVNIVAVYDGTRSASNRINIYRDGILQTMTIDTDFNPIMTNVNFQLYLGRDHESGSQYLDGNLAEVGVWASSLSNTDVRALARGFRPDMINRSSLRFYAPLLGNSRYDAKNFFVPSSVSSVANIDHPRIINRSPLNSSSFFVDSNIGSQVDEPSYVGHKCMVLYIHRSEALSKYLSRSQDFSLNGS